MYEDLGFSPIKPRNWSNLHEGIKSDPDDCPVFPQLAQSVVHSSLTEISE